MSDTLDRLGGFRGAAQTPDRRPSLNTQAAIAEYDYRFAAWEVIDGDDLKAVCKRLDVPGGPTVLGPKVAALRARLDACAKVGRPPPERPAAPPPRAVARMTAAEAIALALGPTDKARVGLAFDATENASAKEMKGRALVTRTVEPGAEAPMAVSDEAPWRQALKLKVTAAAVKAVAEQEGKDPVKELRAAGFTQEAERLRAELDAALFVAPPAPTLASATSGPAFGDTSMAALLGRVDALRDKLSGPLVIRPVSPPFELTPGLPHIEFKPEKTVEWQHIGPRWFGVAGSIFGPAVEFTVIAGTADDIPSAAELADEITRAETLWELTHSAETVLAAQAEHARQRAFLQQLGKEDEEEGAEDEAGAPVQHAPLSAEALRAHMAYPEPLPTVAAPKMPVARGRSTRTLEASAQTPVVKKLRTTRPSASSPAPSASAAPKAQPPLTAPPVKHLPLPTWPEKAKAAPSDPPPKRDRSRHRKVAPKPPEPAQPVLLGMSPETTTPTNIGRPKRRKVAPPAPVVVVPKVKAPKVKAPRPPKAVAAPKARPAPPEVELPAEVQRATSPEIQQLLIEAVKVCRKLRTGRSPAATDVAPFVPIDLAARVEELHHNAQTIMRAPRPAHAKLSDQQWHEQLTLLVKGTISAYQIAETAKIPASTVMNCIRRTGGSLCLLPYIDHQKGRRARKPVILNPVNAKTARGMKRLRARYALTSREFAGCLGVADSTVTRLEQGVDLPRPEVIRAAVAAFGISWREVLHVDDDAWLLKELIAMSYKGRLGVLYRHMLAKFILPEFGLASLLKTEGSPKPNAPGANPTISDPFTNEAKP